MNCIFQFLINVLVSVIMCQYVILYDLLRALTWVGCFGRTHHANRLLCRFRTAERLECGPGLTTKWSRPQNKRQEHGVETWRHCRQDSSTPETERKMREVHRRGAKEWEEKKIIFIILLRDPFSMMAVMTLFVWAKEHGKTVQLLIGPYSHHASSSHQPHSGPGQRSGPAQSHHGCCCCCLGALLSSSYTTSIH